MRVGINITPLENANKYRGVGSYTRNLVESLEQTGLNLLKFKNISEINNVDVIHYPWFDLFFRTLPLRQKFPIVVTIHDVMPLVFPSHHPVGVKGRVNLYFQKLALKKCRLIITISNASKKDIVKYLGVKEHKIKVIYQASAEQFKPLPDTSKLQFKRRLKLPDRFLLYVGDANYVKNLPFLIEGFKTLLEDGKFKDLKLVLIGGVFLKKVDDIDHPELLSLKKTNQLIRQFNLEDKIIRPGRVSDEDLAGFYNLATIYIQPSLYEGFGLPVLEAMSCGCPVVCSNAASLPEVGGDAPLYFKPTDMEGFVSLVSQLLMSRSLSNKLTGLGLKRAAKFSWKKVTEETVNAYKEAIK